MKQDNELGLRISAKFRLSLKTLYGGKAMSGEDDFGEE